VQRCQCQSVAIAAFIGGFGVAVTHVNYPAGFASWAGQMMRTEVRSAVRASRTIRGKRDVDVMVKIGSDSAVWRGHVDDEE
jgi:hypothetical protein